MKDRERMEERENGSERERRDRARQREREVRQRSETDSERGVRREGVREAEIANLSNMRSICICRESANELRQPSVTLLLLPLSQPAV